MNGGKKRTLCLKVYGKKLLCLFLFHLSNLRLYSLLSSIKAHRFVLHSKHMLPHSIFPAPSRSNESQEFFAPLKYRAHHESSKKFLPGWCCPEIQEDLHQVLA